MIQELLGGDSLISGQRKSSINGGGILLPPTLLPPCSLPSSTTSVTNTSTATTTATANTSSNSENQNLRCPRCDSSNTKFCYYNNYNLTQPRHFCKTCRRYWTKGGALRNVPIGGGCRKNKSIGMSSSAAKTSTTKMKTVASELGTLGRPRLGGGFEHELPPSPSPSPILWGSPQNTHLLALLRASQNQNSNPNPSPSLMSITVKEEGNNLMGSQSHNMLAEPLVSNGMLNPRTLGYDSVGHVPSLGLCSSFWINNQDQTQQQNGSGFVLVEQQNSGIQELYQKLRSSSSSSSANYCSNNNLPMFLGNLASNTSSISNILEPTSVSGGELGYWNPTISNPWSDLPTTNGAYP